MRNVWPPLTTAAFCPRGVDSPTRTEGLPIQPFPNGAFCGMFLNSDGAGACNSISRPLGHQACAVVRYNPTHVP